MKVSDFTNIKCDPAPTNVSLFSVIVSLWSITTSLVEWWLFSIFGQCFVNMQTHEITSSQHFFFNHAMSFKVITIFIFQVSLVASIQRSRWSRWWILCNRKMKNENISMFSISLDFLSLTLKAHLAHANDTWDREKLCDKSDDEKNGWHSRLIRVLCKVLSTVSFNYIILSLHNSS